MSMKELRSKFLSLLWYVPYIIEDNPKIQRFLSCLPTSLKERIEFEFDNPKTLEEAMRKIDFCYEQIKKRESIPNWKNKRTSNFDQKRKGFKSNKNFENNSRNFYKNNHHGTDFKSKTHPNTTTPKGRDMRSTYG